MDKNPRVTKNRDENIIIEVLGFMYNAAKGAINIDKPTSIPD